MRREPDDEEQNTGEDEGHGMLGGGVADGHRSRMA
jgi:hypothetical protein